MACTPGVSIDNREQLHRTSILRAGGHEVVRPDMIGMLRLEPDTGAIRTSLLLAVRYPLPSFEGQLMRNFFSLALSIQRFDAACTCF